ncbi:hypothetical protein [Ilumatobacter sp.]|uniref:hypothetical protein n=1 Tax=Ilumatobacter sp. TaxID=1967498 RepID=UPI003B527C05
MTDVGRTIDVDGRSWPTAVVDARDDPAVSDLARVHAVEGVGDVTTEAALVATDPTDDATSGVDHLLVVSVAVTVPVICTFAIVFSLPLHGGFLDDVVASGDLVIATTEPRAAAHERPLWLAVDIDGDRLGSVLAGR